MVLQTGLLELWTKLVKILEKSAIKTLLIWQKNLVDRFYMKDQLEAEPQVQIKPAVL